MPQLTDSRTLAFLAGLISASFGAGITFALWEAERPTKQEIALALGCTAYNSTLEGCTAAADAKEARRELMALREDLKLLRKDLSRGFGRSLSTSLSARDSGGKIAILMFERELASGVPPVEALRHVMEQDFP